MPIETLIDYSYVGLDERNIVIGYSSCKNSFEKEVEIPTSDLPEDLPYKFSCYEYKPDTKKLVLNEELLHKEINTPDPLTDIQQIAQKQSQTELELMLLKRQIASLTGGR